MRKIAFISAIGIIIVSFIESVLAVPPTQLTLEKEVVGGEATTTDWVLTADGTDTNDLNGAGWVSGLVTPDTFTLSESAGPPGYVAGDWDCTGGDLDGQSLTLSDGDVVTCTIINTYAPPPVIFDTDLALPSMPLGDGAGTPVCVDDVSGLLVAGCDVTITADEIDPTTVQKRVDGACAPGSLVSAINEDGSVVCETDIDTTYSAGTGLDLSGNIFIADPSDYNSIPQRSATSSGTTPTTTAWVTTYFDSITAPSVAGRVIAIAGTEFRVGSMGGSSAVIRFGLTTSSTGTPADYARHYVQNEIGLTYQHSSSHAVFSVAAGSTTTVYYRSYSEQTDDTFIIYSPRILLFFIPD
jgi:hypothetical protein